MQTETLSPPRALKRARDRVRRSRFGQLPPFVRKVVVGVIGGTVVLLGVVMIALPGPAIVVIPLGLGILASEFVWAQRVVKRGKLFFERVRRQCLDHSRALRLELAQPVERPIVAVDARVGMQIVVGG